MKQEGENVNPSGGLSHPPNQGEQITHIVISPPKRSPEESRIIEMSGDIRIRLKENLSGADSLQEFIRRYYILSLFNMADISWMWGDGAEPTQDEVINFFNSGSLKKNVSKDTSAVKELMPKLGDFFK